MTGMAYAAPNCPAIAGRPIRTAWYVRPLFWLFVVAFNVVGAADLVLDYSSGRLAIPVWWRSFGWQSPRRSRRPR